MELYVVIIFKIKTQKTFDIKIVSIVLWRI